MLSTARRSPVRRRRLAVAALVVALLGAVAAPTQAAPSGPAAEAPAPDPVDRYSTYDPQRTCEPSVKPGARAILRMVLRHYGVGRDTGISRDCAVGGTSEHKEGRAFDWGLSVDRPAEKAAGDAFTAWLTADGPDGRPGYNARRLGVMYVIWNRQIWAAYDTKTGWRAYYGASPHTDHVHVSLNWDGAYQRTSWWDQTAATSLVRTATNGTVYLVSGDRKFTIDNVDLMVALGSLGPVSVVSQAYVDSRTTGPAMRRVVLAPDGTVYFVDAGIRLPFGSCAQVVDFGFSCGQAIPLEANQIAKLYPGPPMSNLYRTTSGKAFWVTDGTRREVSDTAALVAAGLPTGSVTLLESGIGYLPLAAPVTRDGQVLRSRTTATTVLSAGGRYTPLPGGLDATPGIASLPSAALDEASLARLPLATALHPVIKDSTTARVYLLTTTGKVHLTDPTPVPATPPTTTSAVLARIPDAGTASTPVFVKSPTNATVNYLHAGQRRPIGSWTDLVGLNNGGPTPVIHTLPGTATTLLTPGPTQVAPGTLIKSPDNGTVYLTHGTGSRITVTSFTTTTELGATRLVTLPTADVNRYTLTPGTLTTAIACGPARYLALSGRLHPLTPTTATAYAITTYTTLDPTTCTALPRTTQPLGRFLATPDGTIYHVTHGTKHPISSWTTYLTLGGTPTTTTPITHAAAALIPTA